MPDNLVPYEIAVRLKEVGFKEPVRNYFLVHLNRGVLEEFDEEEQDYNSGLSWHYSRPSLHEVTDWLRERGLHVMTDADGCVWVFGVRDLITGSLIEDFKDKYISHSAALLAGIDKALTILKEGI